MVVHTGQIITIAYIHTITYVTTVQIQNVGNNLILESGMSQQR